MAFCYSLHVTCLCPASPSTCPLCRPSQGSPFFPSTKVLTGTAEGWAPASLGSARGSLLPTWLITHAKIGNELLIPFFFFLIPFPSTHAKGKKRSRYFKCLINSTAVELGWELIWPAAASCFAQSLQIPAHFQFTANFLVVPARPEEV